MPRTSDPKNQRQAGWQGVDQGMTILGELIAAVAVWGGAGYGLDRLFHTWPILFLIGTLFGWGIWVYMVYRRGFPGVTPRKDERKP
jgi:ATP synthase protein I